MEEHPLDVFPALSLQRYPILVVNTSASTYLLSNTVIDHLPSRGNVSISYIVSY